MRIINELEKYDKNAKIALIIRHGDRDEIPDGEFGNDVLLNKKGIRNSIQFGKGLSSFSINKIFSSPVQRCIQTAENIVKGFNQNIQIAETKTLGDPGVYIYDEKSAGKYFLEKGFEKLYIEYMFKIKIPGMYSITDGSIKMENFIKDYTKYAGITIFVTHDSLIAFFDYYLKKKIYTKENWVKYLDGIIYKVS